MHEIVAASGIYDHYFANDADPCGLGSAWVPSSTADQRLAFSNISASPIEQGKWL